MLTETWTSLPVKAVDSASYVTVELEAGLLPTIGANGTVWRREALRQWRDRDYLFDVDVPDDLARSGKLRFAKVKIGIVHLYANGLRQFASKQTRRIRDYLYFRRSGRRSDQWGARHKRGAIAICDRLFNRGAAVERFVDRIQALARSGLAAPCASVLADAGYLRLGGRRRSGAAAARIARGGTPSTIAGL